MFSSFSSFVFDNPSLCHCISILNSCISPSPVTRRSPSLLLVIPGLPLIVFGYSPLLGCHLQFPFLPIPFTANCAPLSVGTVYAFGKWPCLGAAPSKWALIFQLERTRARIEVLTTLVVFLWSLLHGTSVSYSSCGNLNFARITPQTY